MGLLLALGFGVEWHGTEKWKSNKQANEAAMEKWKSNKQANEAARRGKGRLFIWEEMGWALVFCISFYLVCVLFDV